MKAYSFAIFRTCLALLIVSLVPATCLTQQRLSATPAQSNDDAPNNVWGGEHVEMEFTKDGANLDFDCATGTIGQPISPDSNGKFQVSGTYTREMPGPTPRNGRPASAAVYSGTIRGNTMQLEVILADSKESVGVFQLAKGSSGRVMKCR